MKLKYGDSIVKISQGDYGIKVVDGETYEDCIFGLGYVHGRDRLWNLHFMRMLSSGRLAEVIKMI